MGKKKHKKHNKNQNEQQNREKNERKEKLAAEQLSGQAVEQKSGEKSKHKPDQKQTDQKQTGQKHVQKTEQTAQLQPELKSNQKQNQKPEKKYSKSWRLVIVIILVVLLALVAAALLWYGHKVDYYQDRYLQNTYINAMECSEMTPKEVAYMLDEQAKEYSLVIVGRNEQGEKIELGSVTGQEIDMALADAFGGTEDILLQQDEWMWIKSLNGDAYSYSIQQGVTFDAELLRQKLSEMEALQEENMIAPTDAYIGDFSEKEGAYELVAQTEGTTLDVEAAMAYAEAAIYGNETSVDLEELGCYTRPKITVEDKALVKKWKEINRWLKADITYDWNGHEVKVDTNVIKEWVSLQDGKAVMDGEKVAAFVEENALEYDTYGKTRTVTTTLGVKKTLPSGAFGWRTDREAETVELINLIKEGAVTEREPIFSSIAPAKGMNDIGSSYVEADLTNQHLYLYYKGNLVLETDFVSGDMRVSGNITPQGVFGLTYKTKNAVLRGANYETPVSYWLPFHGNFGMHDATWRTEFGGDIYLTNGSHGCLNLPLDKAAELYSYLYTGYPVICYY